MSPTPQVDFYVLETDDREAAERFLCRLCEKAARLQQQVLVLMEAAQIQQLDDLLWRFRADSFLPHAAEGSPEFSPAQLARLPVLLSAALNGPSGRDVLINLRPGLPPEPLAENRIAEVVWGETAVKAAARERFREYRALGLTPTSHQIDARF